MIFGMSRKLGAGSMELGAKFSAFGEKADQAFVFAVVADPKPYVVFVVLNGQGADTAVDASRPEAAGFLEVQRRMPGIGLQQLELFVGLFPALRAQLIVAVPESTGCP